MPGLEQFCEYFANIVHESIAKICLPNECCQLCKDLKERLYSLKLINYLFWLISSSFAPPFALTLEGGGAKLNVEILKILRISGIN